MKQIIKDVLNLHGEMNVNLASDAARDVIAIEIIEKLKKKGFYTKYRKPELEEQEAKNKENSSTLTIENIHHYLDTGINAISIGALTHRIISKDIRLEFIL